MSARCIGETPSDAGTLLASFRRRAALMTFAAVATAGAVALPIGQWQIEHDASRRASDAVARLSTRLAAAGTLDGANAEDITHVLQSEHLVGFLLIDGGSGQTLMKSVDPLRREGTDALRTVQRAVSDASGRHLFLTGYYHVPSAFARLTSVNALWAMVSATLGALIASALGYVSFRRSLRQVTALGDQLLESNLTLLRTLGSAVAHRDAETDSHNYRVALNAMRLGALLDLSPRDLRALTIGAFLHDIGKLAVPDAILRKPGPLDHLEREVMKTHVQIGAQIVAKATWLVEARCVVLHHHERFDGTGYPYGLKGTQIPEIARVFAVIDVFDALTSVRPYKAAYDVVEACELIRTSSGTHFDPNVCAVFLGHANEFDVEQSDRDLGQLRSQLDRAVRHLFAPLPARSATSAMQGLRDECDAGSLGA